MGNGEPAKGCILALGCMCISAAIVVLLAAWMWGWI